MISSSITLYFIAGMIAATTLWIAHRMIKTYPMRCLSYYFYYLVFLILGNFTLRPVAGIVVDILDLTGLRAQKFYTALWFFVAGPLFIIGLYMLIKFAAGLVETRVIRGFKIVYFLYWGGLLVWHFFLVISFFKTDNPAMLDITSEISDLLSIAMLLSVHGFVIIRSRSLESPEKRKGMRNFGLIYFISLAVFNLVYYVIRDRTVFFILSFAYVLPPLLYLGRFLKRFYREYPAVPAEGTVIKQLFARYKISGREQEVIRLISQGRTNREIADMLFVSLQTVKQHTYHIFRKLKVKNRVQLTNFIRNAAGEDPETPHGGF